MSHKYIISLIVALLVSFSVVAEEHKEEKAAEEKAKWRYQSYKRQSKLDYTSDEE